MSIKIKTLDELIHRPSVSIASNSAAFEFYGGEFININEESEVEKLLPGGELTIPWVVFQDTFGRYDRLGTGKVTVVYGFYFADIDVYDGTPATPWFNGQQLTASYMEVTDSNGRACTGAFVTPAVQGDVVVARCMCPPGSSPRGDGWMRILVVSPYTLG